MSKLLKAKEAAEIAEFYRNEHNEFRSTLFWNLMKKINEAANEGHNVIRRELDHLNPHDVDLVVKQFKKLGYTVIINKGNDPKRVKAIERYWNFMLIKW